MTMVVRYFDGRGEEVVFLGACGNTLRVVTPKVDDVVEFSLYEGQWFSEEYEPVEIEFAGVTCNGGAKPLVRALPTRNTSVWPLAEEIWESIVPRAGAN